MSKIMSMFEKLNLVEKVNDEDTTISEVNYNNIVEEHKMKEIEECTNEEDMKNYEPSEEKNESVPETNLVCDKNMAIGEIYSLFQIENTNNHTIFKLEKFINAIPENLPYEIKKQSVINIIDASDTDLNMLLSDGERRLNVLKKFGKEYYNGTISSIEQHKAEITKLNSLINKYKEQIHNRESMLEEQNNVLEFEIEKIIKTINFFKNGD